MLCIPKKDAEMLKQAIRNGDFTLSKLSDMSEKEMSAIFSRYTGEGLGNFLGGRFKKAFDSNRKDSLKKLVGEVFNTAEKQKIAIEKIEKATEVNDTLLNDLAAVREGYGLSDEQVKTLIEKTEKIKGLSDQKTELGLPSKEYLKAYNEMERYVQSFTPTHNLRILTSLMGRTMMLFRPSSILFNIEGNTLNGITNFLEKKIGYGFKGGVNNDVASKFIKENLSNYLDTGYDFTRMNELTEGHKILTEEQIHTEGKGFIRKVIGKYSKKFLELTQGAPDVWFASRAFANTADIHSTVLARSEGLEGVALKNRAKEIFMDSFKMKPVTKEGQEIRDLAQADAAYATYTNESKASKLSLKIRSAFNDLIPDLRLGDLNIPFAKTPANVISQGIEMAGGSTASAGYHLVKFKEAWQNFGKGSPEAKNEMRKVVRDLSKLGLGFMVSSLVAANVGKDDFIGAYPTTPSEQELFKERNGIENSIKIGDKWVSVAYFGPFAPAILGALYAKKYASDGGFIKQAFQYARGAGAGILELPGIKQTYETIKYLIETSRRGKTTEDIANESINGLIDFAIARTIPGIVSDITKAGDDYERKTDKSAISKAQATIPGLRQNLPIKTTALGEKVETESALSIFLFGSRLKTAEDNSIIREFIDLSNSGNLPSLSDIEKTSTRVKSFKEQVPVSQYNKAISTFKDEFSQKTKQLIRTDKYRTSDDETKAKMINGLKDDILTKTLNNFGYKKPKKK